MAQVLLIFLCHTSQIFFLFFIILEVTADLPTLVVLFVCF